MIVVKCKYTKTTDRKPRQDNQPGAIDILLSNYFHDCFLACGLFTAHLSSGISQPS